MKKIAILGATGYIGKSLAYELSLKNKFEVFLFSRSVKKLEKFLSCSIKKNRFKAFHLKNFNNYRYDVVINCIGIGNSSVLKKTGTDILKITEKFDDLILDYLENSPKTLYINLSSGAVYGDSFDKPIDKNSTLNANKSKSMSPYSMAKVKAEEKHRFSSYLNIVDLRIFSFFSQFIDLKSGFFMADVVKCIKNKETLKTSVDEMVRDYVTTKDLLELIKACMKKPSINDFFDVYSANPISKIDILKYFEKNYGLKYQFTNSSKVSSPTGTKNQYYSKNKKAGNLGYIPKFSSLRGIEREIRKIILK